MLSITDISFQYPGAPQAALSGVSLRVQRGRVLAC